MGIDQKIENILGKLSIILPSLEKYESIVREQGERIRGVEEKLVSELRNIYVRLRVVEEQDRKGSDRLWNLITILVSCALSAIVGLVIKK